MVATHATMDLLRASWLFASLSEDDLAQLLAEVRTLRVAPDTVVVRQGDADGDLFAVAKGLLRVSVRAQDGREFALNLLGPGTAFGEVALVDGQERSASVTAVHASELVVVPREAVMAQIERSPGLALKLMTALAGHVRRLTTRSEELSALPIRVRMARKILELAGACGTPLDGNRVALPIDLSQRDLAEHVQATRESVNKCLAGWMRDGVLYRTQRQLVIEDVARLRELADL